MLAIQLQQAAAHNIDEFCNRYIDFLNHSHSILHASTAKIYIQDKSKCIYHCRFTQALIKAAIHRIVHFRILLVFCLNPIILTQKVDNFVFALVQDIQNNEDEDAIRANSSMISSRPLQHYLLKHYLLQQFLFHWNLILMSVRDISSNNHSAINPLCDNLIG